MAIPISVERLLEENIVESYRIEFKKGWNPDTIIRSICAFANDIDNIGGGYILIGIDESNGRPVLPPDGIDSDSLDQIQKELLRYASFITPRYLPVAEPVVYQGKNVLVIWVFSGLDRPYYCPKFVTRKDSNRYYYIRKYSNTIQAQERELAALYTISSSIPYDDRPNIISHVDDLSFSTMLDFLEQAKSQLHPVTLLQAARDMKLLNGPPEDEHPVNAALLFFGKNEIIEDKFPYAFIEVVIIPDPTGKGMIEKKFTGPIYKQLIAALQYIETMVLAQKINKPKNSIQAKTAWNYPIRTIREILANAVYHRDYTLSEPITVRIEKYSIEITSFPGFDSSISEEMVQEKKIRSKIYRNRRIGDYLKELELIEGRNTGFPNARKALFENGSNDLTFEYDAGRQYLSVVIPIHPSFLPPENKTEIDEKYIARILEILKENGPLNRSQIAKKMGLKGITAKLSKYIDLLLEQNKIMFTTDAKGKTLLDIFHH